MSYSLGNHSIDFVSGSVNVVSSNVDTSGATALFAFASSYQVNFSGFSGSNIIDSKGNTGWAKANNSPALDPNSIMFYCANPTSVGAGHNITMTGGNYANLIFLALNGANSSPYDTSSQYGSSSNASNTIPLPSITPANDNEIILVGSYVLSTTTDWSGYGLTFIDGNAVFGHGFDLYYKIQTTATPFAPTGITAANNNRCGVMTALISGGGSPPPATLFRLPLLGAG